MTAPNFPPSRSISQPWAEDSGIRRLLRRACERFNRDDPKFQEFLSSSVHWLDDYTLFKGHSKDSRGDKEWF